jgi:hypothetical protein
MGGYGSGLRSGGPTVDDGICLRLPELRRAGLLLVGGRADWCWRRDGQVYASVHIERVADPGAALVVSFTLAEQPITQLIPLVLQPLPYGGGRWWAICPLSDDRCSTLVLSVKDRCFASVAALGMAYGSQREHEVGRAIRRVQGLERRLCRSRYTRRPTRQRLQQLIQQDWLMIDDDMDARFARAESWPVKPSRRAVLPIVPRLPPE